MRILVASNLFPWPLDRAIAQRIYHLTARLAARHEVTFVSLLQPDGNPQSPLDQVCERVIVVDEWYARWGTRLWDPIAQGLKDIFSSALPAAIARHPLPKLTSTLRELRSQQQFDVVWAQRSAVAESARRAGFQNVVVDLADLDSQVLGRQIRALGQYPRRVLHELEHRKLQRYEKNLARRFLGVTVCKAEDRKFFGAHADRAVLVPNGVGEVPETKRLSPDPGELLFIGTLDYEPNLDACLYFVREVLPLVREHVPHARLTIVGRAAGPDVIALHDDSTCRVVPNAPDVDPYYDRAEVVVAPVRLGSGTRIKILEALSRGKAVVSTTIGAEGLGLVHGQHLLIADSAEELAGACGRLLTDPSLARQLGNAGRELVRERFTYDAISKLAEKGLADLVAAGPSRPNTRATSAPGRALR